MADLTVQILFSGLIAFVPIDAQSKVATVLVLNDVSSYPMAHRAFLSVQSGKVDELNSPFLFGADPTDAVAFPKARRTFVGAGFVLSIKGLSAGNPEYYNFREMLPWHNDTSKKRISLLKANELRGGNYSPDSDLFDVFKLAAAKVLALRFSVNTGILQPYDQISDGGVLNGRKIKWEYPAGNWNERYVPEMMEWKSPKIQEKFITLVLDPIGGGPSREIKIQSDSGKSIRILISNEPEAAEFCASGIRRYSVGHLARLARFSGGNEVKTAVPELVEKADMLNIDDACRNNGVGGRQPLICYGNEME